MFPNIECKVIHMCESYIQIYVFEDGRKVIDRFINLNIRTVQDRLKHTCRDLSELELMIRAVLIDYKQNKFIARF